MAKYGKPKIGENRKLTVRERKATGLDTGVIILVNESGKVLLTNGHKVYDALFLKRMAARLEDFWSGEYSLNLMSGGMPHYF
jgi:hypothetical protein